MYIYICVYVITYIHIPSNSPSFHQLCRPHHWPLAVPPCFFRPATSAPRMPSSSHMNCPVQSLVLGNVGHGYRISWNTTYGIWVCLKIVYPIFPMVLLIIIPIFHGYFIGKINPTSSDKPISHYITSSAHQQCPNPQRC